MSNFISPEAQARHAQAVAAYSLSEQKRSQSNAIRFVLNFPIIMAVLYALSTVGLITITASTVGLTGLLTTIAVIALIFMLICVSLLAWPTARSSCSPAAQVSYWPLFTQCLSDMPAYGRCHTSSLACYNCPGLSSTESWLASLSALHRFLNFQNPLPPKP